MSEQRVIEYNPEPTLAAFHNSPSQIRGVRGPIGSGKSVGCCMDIVTRHAVLMPPMSDGVVRGKILVMRNTYGELVQTTIPTLIHWFPMMKMHWSPPLTGHLDWPMEGGHMELDFLFWGMDQDKSEDSLKSLELSMVWANEASQIAFSRISQAFTRTGRYPSEPGKSFPSIGLIMDTNSPDNTNWWYHEEFEHKEPSMAFFAQPPVFIVRVDPVTKAVTYEDNVGQDPGIPPAENVKNLNEGFWYWRKQLPLLNQDQIDRLILNRIGTRKEGRPVYPEYQDSFHISKTELTPDFGLPILLGQDFGRTPAAVIGQITTGGQIKIFEEVTSDNMGIDQFVQEKLRPLLINKYHYYSVRTVCFGDPAGADPNQVDDVTCIQRMNELGIPCIPSPVAGNSQLLRINAVSNVLRERRDGGPAIIIDPKCKMIRDGFIGSYCYRKMRKDGDEERYADAPEKNMYSHPHDALQYLVCGIVNGGQAYNNPFSENSPATRQMVENAGSGLGDFGV